MCLITLYIFQVHQLYHFYGNNTIYSLQNLQIIYADSGSTEFGIANLLIPSCPRMMFPKPPNHYVVMTNSHKRDVRSQGCFFAAAAAQIIRSEVLSGRVPK